jgi:hypothetical protein
LLVVHKLGALGFFEILQAAVPFRKLHSFCFLVHEFWLQTFAGWWWCCWGFFISCFGEKLRLLFKGLCVLLISPRFFFGVGCGQQLQQAAMAASNSLTFVTLLPLVLVMVRPLSLPLSLSLSSDHIYQLLKISFLACLLWIDFFSCSNWRDGNNGHVAAVISRS